MLVSNNFRRMIKKKTFVYDTFDWQEFSHLKVPHAGTEVRTYTCD